MKKMTLKILILILFVVLKISVTCIIFAVISNGKIKPFTDETGKIIPESISQKIIVNINGAKNGFFIRGKNINNPVLLFISSGPGTSDYFYNEAYPDMNLEEYFTVCYWDYRGMCLVYDKNINPQSITTQTILEDTKAVTEYLKSKFNKEKIYIMGFSGGTHIALEAVSYHPEDYYAYFAMAQAVTSNNDRDTIMYNFMKEVFEKRNDKKNLSKLEKSVIHLDDNKVECKDWPSFVFLVHNAGGGTIKDKSEFTGIIIPILKSHCYTIKEKFNYIRGMKMYRNTPFYADVTSKDYRTIIPKIDIPVFFISGSSDYNCPWPLVEEYYNLLDCPKKDFKLIDNAAHSPLWENPKETVNYMIEMQNELLNF